jgi:hypothetical protein
LPEGGGKLSAAGQRFVKELSWPGGESELQFGYRGKSCAKFRNGKLGKPGQFSPLSRINIRLDHIPESGNLLPSPEPKQRTHVPAIFMQTAIFYANTQ